MFSSKFLVSALVASASCVFGLPYQVAKRASIATNGNLNLNKCSLKGAQMVLPTNQTKLTLPTASNETINWVMVGRGVQNYTCSSGAYTSIGAVAQLFDASCFINDPIFTDLSTIAYMLPNPAETPVEKRAFTPTSTQIEQCQNAGIPSASLSTVGSNVIVPPNHLGNHYFVEFNGALAPKFDMTPAIGVRGVNATNEFVIASKTETLASPSNSTTDVAWLQLAGISGTVSDFVYRTYTVGGQPPSSCTGSGTISVQYAAIYYGFKASA